MTLALSSLMAANCGESSSAIVPRRARLVSLVTSTLLRLTSSSGIGEPAGGVEAARSDRGREEVDIREIVWRREDGRTAESGACYQREVAFSEVVAFKARVVRSEGIRARGDRLNAALLLPRWQRRV